MCLTSSVRARIRVVKGNMDEGAQMRFMKRYGELSEVSDKFYAEVDRVRSDPEMFAPLEDVLSPSR